jgi:hypothetical protein
MSSSDVVLLVIGLCVAAAIVFLLTRGQRRQLNRLRQCLADHTAQLEHALPASAMIVEVRSTKLPRTIRAELTLQVRSPDGKEYQTLTVWRIDAAELLARLQPGHPISIKIDADDPQKIYPNAAGFRYWLWDSV